MNSTPVFNVCSDIDLHIPVESVRITAEIINKSGTDIAEII